MVLMLNPPPRNPSFSERLGAGISEGLVKGTEKGVDFANQVSLQQVKNKKENSMEKKNYLGLIQRQRELLSTGHVGAKIGVSGTGRDFGSTFSPEGRRIRSEYEQIGKALIQAAAPLKITNRAEFQHFAKSLEDTTLTIEEMTGILNGLERIVTGSAGSSTIPTQKQSVKEKPPLSSFYE